MSIALPVVNTTAAGHLGLPRYTVSICTAEHMWAYLDQVQRCKGNNENVKKGGLISNFYKV